jgi:hypothetical protein
MADKYKLVDRSSGYRDLSWDSYYKSGGAWIFNGSGTGVGRRFHVDWRNRAWNITPNWKVLRANQGYLPTTAYSDSFEYVQAEEGALMTFEWYNGTGKIVMKSQDDAYVPRNVWSSEPYGFSESTYNMLKDDAKAKALAKARDMKVNVPVMLGEGRQTVKMLADTVRTLGKAYRSFRRGRFQQAAKDLGITKPTGDSAKHWLAYRYGWQPLLSDAAGLYKLANKGLIDPERGPRFSVSAKALITGSVDVTVVGQGTSVVGGDSRLKGIKVGEAKAGLLLEFTSRASGLESVGLGRYDPLLTAWELTPFSFVFDWFLDIGSYLENLSSLESVTVLAGYTSLTQICYGRSVISAIGYGGQLVGGTMPAANFTFRRYTRDHWEGTISLRTPLWDGLNAKRLTDAAALWRQICRGDRVPGKYRP